MKRDGNLGREPLIHLLCILAGHGHRLALKTNTERNGPAEERETFEKSPPSLVVQNRVLGGGVKRDAHGSSEGSLRLRLVGMLPALRIMLQFQCHLGFELKQNSKKANLVEPIPNQRIPTR